jgi:hypothetical protein
MATNPFGSRMDDDVRPKFKRPAEVPSGAKRVVDDKRNPVIVGDFCNRLKVGNV